MAQYADYPLINITGTVRMSTERQVYNLKVDPSGRIVLPAPTRERLHISGGDTVMIVEDETGVHLKTRSDSGRSPGVLRHPRTSGHIALRGTTARPALRYRARFVTSAVLDASALIALLRSEPGAEVVAKVLGGAIISAVNYAEVLKKGIERGGPLETIAAVIRDLSIAIIPFDDVQAAGCAALYPEGKPHGMSLADRACLALGVARRLTVLTAERKMALLSLPIKVKLIRNAH